MTQRIRLGVVGCGVIGQIHIRAAKPWPSIDLAAIADLRPDVRKKTADEFGVRRTHAEGQDLIDDPEVDAVVLAMPTCVRTALALRALRRGKHVLLEKPVAMNAAEVREMITARDAHGARRPVVACCSSRLRFQSGADTATQFLATGALGTIRVVRIRAIIPAGGDPATQNDPPPPWRVSRSQNGGGFLVNWGCYDMDYVFGILGWRVDPRLALAQMWQIAPQFSHRVAAGSDGETHYAILIRCGDGSVITMERGEQVSTAADSAWQIIGEKGSLRLSMGVGDKQSVIFDDASTREGVVSRTLWEGPQDWTPFLNDPIRDFADAIVGGRPPRTGLEESLLIQRITDAAYRSADTGEAVLV